MNKLILVSILLIGGTYADTISIPIQSHRTVDVRTLDVERDPNISPHVFEIEPVQAPLRIVFSSESSPLSVDVEKAFIDSVPAGAVNAKQDRSGAVNTGSVSSASDAGAGYDDQEYRIVDSYQRYVPVKVSRDSFENIFSGTEQVVNIRAPGGKATGAAEAKKQLKKVIVPVKKTNRLVVIPAPTKATAKPTTAAPVVPTVSAKVTAQTEAPVATEAKIGGKFGARLTRHTEKQQKSDKSTKDKKAKSE